jgi:rhamnose transport system ATP-binding protein
MLSFLQIHNLCKSYGGVQALSDVSMTIEAGEIHALMGENGAGKSTFIKCLSGAVAPDSGVIQLDGQSLPLGDIRAAEAAGIAALHQESTAFPQLNAQDNIFVGREPRRGPGWLDRPRMRRETEALLQRLGERVDINCPLEDLSLAQRQMIGIARALSRQSRLLILDEPTASLSARETETLFRIIRQLQAEGVSILYISHRLEEVFALASRVTVLRDGQLVETRALSDVTRDELVHLMVGRELLSAEKPTASHASGSTRLQVENLSGDRFQDITFTLRAGEIVGLAGLVGAGRSETAAAIFGLTHPRSGQVLVDGSPLPPGSVTAAMRAGLALVPEDRQQEGLILPLSVGSNLLLSVIPSLTRFGFRSRTRERTVVAEQMQSLGVKATGPDIPANTLSGGNQQKLVLGKGLATHPRVLLLDEPTRGVDVGAKADLYGVIRQFAQQGLATLIISSDLPELLALCDRILVMREGRISGELSRAEADEAGILALALPATPNNTGGRDDARD